MVLRHTACVYILEFERQQCLGPAPVDERLYISLETKVAVSEARNT